MAAVGRTRASARRTSPAVAFGAAFLFIGLNVGIYVVPIDYRVFGAWAYPGVFLVTLIANAAMVVPVPYIPVVMHVFRSVELIPLAIAAAALGSVIGESTGWLVGRAEKDLISDNAVYKRLQGVVSTPWRAGLLLFALAAPPNPLFDVAGVAAGALGMPYRTFFVAVLSGRIVRMIALAWGVHALHL